MCIRDRKLGEGTNLARALNIATAALVAEMVGGMQRVLDLTVDLSLIHI